MRFFLAGVISLNGPRPRRSAFLIPFFRCDQSNSLFVQDLAHDQTVQRFCRFDAFRYDVITDVDAVGIERAIGDVGLMSYIRAGEPVIVAEASEMVRQIQLRPPSHSDSPVFAIEAYSLIGDLRELRKAIKRAAKEFGSDPWVMRWASMETLLAVSHRSVTSHSSADWIQENLDKLARDFEDEKWPARWRRTWTDSKQDERLTALGVTYVRSMQSRENRFDQSIQVLNALVTRREGLKRGPSAKDIEQLAIASTSALPPIQASKKARDGWGKILSAVLRSHAKLSDENAALIRDYLAQEAGAHGRIVDVWRELWNVLLKHDRVDAATLLLSEAQVATNASPALQRIMRTIAVKQHDPRLKSLVFEWVTTHPTYTNAWIDAYLRLLVEYEGNPELIRVGEEWLKADPGKTRRWPQIRSILEQYTGNKMRDELRSWLLRANKGMTSWAPTILEWLRENRDDNEMKEVALSWLSQHEQAEAAWELSELLKGDGKEESRVGRTSESL